MQLTKQAIKNLHNKLKRIAKDFDLNYEPRICSYIFVSGTEFVMRDYLAGCPDPDYLQFGKTYKDRINNIEKFWNSPARNKYNIVNSNNCYESGGCVLRKKYIQKDLKYILKIKNKQIKKKYTQFYSKLIKKLEHNKFVVLLTKPDSAQLSITKRILLHEWIHLLLHHNKIHFGAKRRLFDEGLTTYLECYAYNDLVVLKSISKQNKNKLYKEYVIYAAKWKKLLTKKTNPSERKNTILRTFYSSRL